MRDLGTPPAQAIAETAELFGLTQGHISFPTRREIFENGRTGELDEAFGFLCWIMPDAILAKGKAELDALYKKTGPGISVEERTRIIADLDAEHRLVGAFASPSEQSGLSAKRTTT